jgi:hypothetical protein
VEGGRRAVCASDGDEKEGAWGGASFHADQHEQSRIYVKGPISQQRRYYTYGKMLPTTQTRPRPSASTHNIIITNFERMAVGEHGDWHLTEFHLLYGHNSARYCSKENLFLTELVGDFFEVAIKAADRK